MVVVVCGGVSDGEAEVEYIVWGGEAEVGERWDDDEEVDGV